MLTSMANCPPLSLLSLLSLSLSLSLSPSLPPSLLPSLPPSLPPSPPSPMIWAACCVGYFGFMMSGEFTVSRFNDSCPISISDVAVDSHSSPSTIRVLLRKAKTDPAVQVRGSHLFGQDWHSSMSSDHSATDPCQTAVRDRASVCEE